MAESLFFDNASTTRCCKEAAEALQHFAEQAFGNPSSSHALGQRSARAIHEARVFFADHFHTSPAQIIFTGSGTEADNLAVSGVALASLFKTKKPSRILVSASEHPAVAKAAIALQAHGCDVQTIPIDQQGQIIREKFLDLLTPATSLVSIQQVNNITGAILPVEELARITKERVPGAIFHTDAVQAFGKIPSLTSPSPVDLVAISAHKIEGPKGVGALIVLNSKLLKSGLQPLIWGGDQESGFRSGTQNAGLISGFHLAAKRMLAKQDAFIAHARTLRDRLQTQLAAHKIDALWNSPKDGAPHIINLSFPGFPSAPLARFIEERGCIISTGSACHSNSAETDPVLTAMNIPRAAQLSAIRISFSEELTIQNIDTLAATISDSLKRMELLGSGKSTGKSTGKSKR